MVNSNPDPDIVLRFPNPILNQLYHLMANNI